MLLIRHALKDLTTRKRLHTNYSHITLLSLWRETYPTDSHSSLLWHTTRPDMEQVCQQKAKQNNQPCRYQERKQIYQLKRIMPLQNSHCLIFIMHGRLWPSQPNYTLTIPFLTHTARQHFQVYTP